MEFVSKAKTRIAVALQALSEQFSMDMQVNARGELLVVQAMPERSELVRMGNSYQGQMSSHIAPLAAVPTGTAALTLYNGEVAGGKSYLIEAIYAWCDTSIAATTVLALFGMLNSTKQSNVQTGALVPKSLSGKPAYGGKGTLTASATVTNEGWLPIATSSPSSGTTTVGLSVYAPCEGLFIVPPGGAFSMHALAEAAAGDFFGGIVWHEVQIPLA